MTDRLEPVRSVSPFPLLLPPPCFATLMLNSRAHWIGLSLHPRPQSILPIGARTFRIRSTVLALSFRSSNTDRFSPALSAALSLPAARQPIMSCYAHLPAAPCNRRSLS